MLIPANDNKRICPHCGAEVAGRSDKKYCGRACTVAAKRKRRYAAGRPYTCTCKRCRTEFHPKTSSRTTFCSRSCAEEYKKENAIGPTPYQKCEKTRLTCQICDAEFVTHQPATKCCSEPCRLELTKRVARQVAMDNHIESVVECRECGDEFVITYGTKLRVYCSAECRRKSGRRAAKQARRARIRATAIETVYAFKVFERDGWTCMSCGIETPIALRGSNDNAAPELDHVVPLAKGGSHTYANTQCLCGICNNLKRDSLPIAA